MPIPIDKALKAYVNIRDDIAAKEKEFKAWKEAQEALLEKIGLFLKTTCNELGTDSVKAGGITAFKKEKDSVAIEDKDIFKSTLATGIMSSIDSAMVGSINNRDEVIAAIANADIFDLLTLSANKTNCKAYMADNDGLMPPGIKYYNEKVIQVRKGSK